MRLTSAARNAVGYKQVQASFAKYDKWAASRCFYTLFFQMTQILISIQFCRINNDNVSTDGQYNIKVILGLQQMGLTSF